MTQDLVPLAQVGQKPRVSGLLLVGTAASMARQTGTVLERLVQLDGVGDRPPTRRATRAGRPAPCRRRHRTSCSSYGRCSRRGPPEPAGSESALPAGTADRRCTGSPGRVPSRDTTGRTSWSGPARSAGPRRPATRARAARTAPRTAATLPTSVAAASGRRTNTPMSARAATARTPRLRSAAVIGDAPCRWPRSLRRGTQRKRDARRGGPGAAQTGARHAASSTVRRQLAALAQLLARAS